MLAGLTASSEAHSQGGLPLLSQIPLLGALFGSNTTMQQNSQNIVLIVPSVVDATSEPARERIRQALEAFRRYDGDWDAVRLHDSPSDQQGPRNPQRKPDLRGNKAQP